MTHHRAMGRQVTMCRVDGTCDSPRFRQMKGTAYPKKPTKNRLAHPTRFVPSAGRPTGNI
jgi:hypothetical protein